MITSQDFDRLSAYIDDQLPRAEKAALEARLAAEPELRATLRDLRLTVGALRALPPVKPPRSFTLTPAQAGAARPRRPLFPTLRLAAAMSALMLTVVVAGDIGSGLLAARPAQVSSEAQVAVTDQAQVAATELVQAPAAAPAATETPMAEGMTESLTVETNEAGSTGADGPAETPMISMMAPAATPTPEVSADRQMSPTADPTVKQLPEGTPTPLSVAEAPPEETLLYDAGTAAASADSAAGSPPPGGLTALRTIEIALAMVTVLLGLGAWFTRRNA